MDKRLPHQRRSEKRAAVILQFVLLFLMMALSALIGVIWFGGERLLFPPTPTPTATQSVGLAPTADFRATLIAEDVATQVAYNTLAAELGLSPLATPTKLPATIPVLVPEATSGGEATPVTSVTPTPDAGSGGGNTAHIPVASNGGSILPTPTPVAFSEVPTPLPSDTPTLPPAVLPSETPTLAPPTPTFTPTPTFFVPSQKAIIVVTPAATLRAGPSNLYGATDTMATGLTVNLIGRDETGEWVLVCCVNNAPRWLRQAYAPPKDNQLQPGAPPGSNPNDVRWLKVEVAPPTTVPILTPTVIPDNSFPHFRRDRSNTGRVPKLPTWPLTPVWPNPNRPDRAMVSAIMVANDKVLVGNADNHLYALGMGEGNQQWRYDVRAPLLFGPVVQDNYIYFIDNQQRTWALQDLGNQAFFVWQKAILTTPLTTFYLNNNRLFVIGRDGAGTEYLYAIDRGTGDTNTNSNSTYQGLGEMAPYLGIGNQLLYISDPSLKALDVNDLSRIWQRDDIQNLMAPPVYVLNGPNLLAELYVVDNSNAGIRLHALNASTGQTIWVTVIGREVSGLAVGDSAVFVTGDNYLRAIPRQGGNPTLWEVPTAGRVVGGPLVDSTQVLLVSVTGMIQGFSISGQPLGNQPVPNGASVIGAPAVAGPYLFIPVDGPVIYAFRGQP